MYSRKSLSAKSFSHKSWMGLATNHPTIIKSAWPDYEITEQMSRATHGLLHQALDRRRAIRRGW